MRIFIWLWILKRKPQIKKCNSAPTLTTHLFIVHKGSYTKGWTDDVQVLSYLRCETSGGKRETASNTSSMELQHHYTIFCLHAYHVKWLYHISNSVISPRLQQWGKEKTGRSSLSWTTQGFINMLKHWLRPAADKGEYRRRTIPSCRKGLLLVCLCKGRLTMLASYSGSNGYPLALSKFLFSNSSNFLGNTTISRYNGYYIYLHRPCTAGI